MIMYDMNANKYAYIINKHLPIVILINDLKKRMYPLSNRL